MTKIERYREQIKELEKRRSNLLRSGRYMESMELNKKIIEIKEMIDELEEEITPRPLSESVSPQELKEMNIVPLMIEAHLVADFLTEVCYMVKDTVKKHGFDAVHFVPELNELIKKSDSFASFLLKMSPDLQKLLLKNETFNASLHKKYLNHIDQRLKQFEKERKQAV